MKPLYLSRHARRRMGLYEISIEDISRVLENPEKVGPASKGRYNAYRRVGERYLRVTYKDEELRVVVVTVTPRRKFEEVS